MALYPYKTLPEDWELFYAEQIHEDLPEYLESFYEQTVTTSQQTMNNTDFVAVDIETTGLDAQQDDIISVGLVPFDAQRIYLSQAQYWVVGTRQLTSDSVVVHGITHSDVAEAPSLRSVLHEIVPHLAGRQIVVHYRYMEREFFRTAIAAMLNCNWLFPVIDTLELEAHYQRRQQSLVGKWLQKSLPSLRLPNARERYNLPAYENHNALTDALATAELLQAQIAKQALKETPVRNLWY